MELHKAAHTVYKTQYHIVWDMRYRRKILVRGVAESLRLLLQEVRKFHPDWFIEEIGIEVDHVHLYMVILPQDAVAHVVATLKSMTSARLKEQFPHFLRKVYGDGRGIWGRGLFVSPVGINEAIIRRYVQYQGAQDTGQAPLEF
ncbi:MAG: IS200/IS605 family transposase [Nitrospirota bacterium]|nr:IS200/IS605 family transposase [Nitrospirota bacterium]